MSDYDFRPGGALKLRGGVAEGGIVKKKKSKSKSKDKEKDKAAEEARLKEIERLMKDKEEQDAEKSDSPAGSSRGSPAIGSSDKKTAAEKRFEEVQKKRLAAKVAKLAHKTHKDRVHDFNSKLEALSEHHDIPKVGPG